MAWDDTSVKQCSDYDSSCGALVWTVIDSDTGNAPDPSIFTVAIGYSTTGGGEKMHYIDTQTDDLA